jgi:hypothetical protein
MTVTGTEPLERYELQGMNRWLPFVVFPMLAVVGTAIAIGALRDGDEVVLAVSVAWLGVAVWMARRYLRVVPVCIEADAQGIRFVARRRTTAVPWTELRSITTRRGRNGEMLLWRWDGGKVLTLSGHRGLHRLLTRIEQLHPHVELDV